MGNRRSGKSPKQELKVIVCCLGLSLAALHCLFTLTFRSCSLPTFSHPSTPELRYKQLWISLQLIWNSMRLVLNSLIQGRDHRAKNLLSALSAGLLGCPCVAPLDFLLISISGRINRMSLDVAKDIQFGFYKIRVRRSSKG